MTPRSFFLILLKVLGIYLILASLTVLAQSLSTLYFMTTNGDGDIMGLVWGIGLLLIAVGIYFLILRFFVFKPEIVIDKLRLDKGFTEEKFELNIHRSTVLKIAIIVIGGLILVETLPSLCRYIISYAQVQSVRFIENPNAGWLIFYIVKSLIGLYLLTNSRVIVNFIEKQRKK